MAQIPRIRLVFPKIDIKKVAKCLELQEVKVFSAIAKERAKIAAIVANSTAEANWYKKIDKRLEGAQGALLEILHESDDAVTYSSVAIDAAIVIATGGARL